MKEYSLHLIYAESNTSDGAFSWYQGRVLTPGPRPERAQLHREMNEIARNAKRERTAAWGRRVLSRDRRRLLVEVRMPAETEGERALGAAIVVSADSLDAEWAPGAAQECTEILRTAGFSPDPAIIEHAFREGWARRPPFDWFLIGRLIRRLTRLRRRFARPLRAASAVVRTWRSE